MRSLTFLTKKSKTILALSLVVLILIQAVPVFASDEIDDTVGYMVIDCTTGEVLLSQNEDTRFYPGSTTKLLTVLCAYDIAGNGSHTLTTTSEMFDLVQKNSSRAYLKGNEVLTLDDLTYAALLPSGNDAARFMAVSAMMAVSDETDIKKLYDSFIVKMNEFSKNLGMNDSNFTSSDGYDDENNYSTVNDMIKLGKAFIENDFFMDVVSTPSYTLETNRATHTWVSTNKLIHEESEYYDSRVKGVKTGTTDDSRTLMFYADDGDRQILGIVMNVDRTDMDLVWRVSSTLIDEALNGFRNIDIKALADDTVERTLTGTTKLFKQNVSFVMDEGSHIDTVKTSDLDNVEIKYIFNDEFFEEGPDGLKLKKDVTSSDKVLTCQIYLNGELRKTANYSIIGSYHHLSTSIVMVILVTVLVVIFATGKIVTKNKGKK